MTSQINFFLSFSVIALFIILTGVILSTLYKRATNERAFVRTGYDGETIVQTTGIFVLPILHRVIPVNLKSINLGIEIANESAILTRDCMKIDLSINFYVRVIAEPDHIVNAARTLGMRTLASEDLKEFLESKLIHSVRIVTAEMSMTEIQQQQGVYVQNIHQAVEEDLLKNSLQLESVTIKHLDQTAKQYFQEDNAFDAAGLSKLSETLETEKKSCSAIEQESRLKIKQKELEMEKLIIGIENKKSRIRLEQEREIKLFKAATALKLAQDASHKHVEEEQAKLLAEQEIELSKQASKASLSIKLREQLKEQVETDLLRAEAARAEERVISARELEKVERQIQIELMKDKLKDEHETAMVTQVATAKKNAAKESAEAERLKASGEADKLRILVKSTLEADESIASSLKNRYQNEAEGVKILIDAINSLSKNEFPLDNQPYLIELLSELIKGNNQLINQVGLIGLNPTKEFSYAGSTTSEYKASHNQDSNMKSHKLEALLEDAHHSLVEEALNTVNEMDQTKTKDQLINVKNIVKEKTLENSLNL